MNNRTIALIIALSTAVLYLIEPSIGLGWLYAWFFIIIRRQLRTAYVNSLSKAKSFNIPLFILYTFLSFAIPIGSVFLAFLLRDWINPNLVLIALVLDYFLWIINGIRGQK